MTEAGEIVFAAIDGGCARLFVAPADGGAARAVPATAGDLAISGLSVSGGLAATVLVTPTSFGEVAILRLDRSDAATPVTAHGASHAELGLLVPEARTFEISDGTSVEGWVLRAPGTEGAGPLLLDVHGGPHNAWNPTLGTEHLYHQELASRGWTILMLNPRGSDGYGEAFYLAVNEGWGEVDANDFLEPIDALVAEGIADPARLVVTGYSYGGFISCDLPSRDGRFAAAIAGGPPFVEAGAGDLQHVTQPLHAPGVVVVLDELEAVHQFISVAKTSSPCGGCPVRWPVSGSPCARSSAPRAGPLSRPPALASWPRSPGIPSCSCSSCRAHRGGPARPAPSCAASPG
ncbi:alpha/beta hydrolase family protein [Streptomyces sp. NPDC001142]